MIKIIDNLVEIEKEKLPVYFSFLFEGVKHTGKLVKEDNAFFFLTNVTDFNGGRPSEKLMQGYAYSWWTGYTGTTYLNFPHRGEEYKRVFLKKWFLSFGYKK